MGRRPGATAEALLVLGNHDVHRGRMLGEAGLERMCAAAVRAGVPPLVFSHPPLTPPPAGAVNVSVERIGFRPVRLDRLIAHNGTVT